MKLPGEETEGHQQHRRRTIPEGARGWREERQAGIECPHTPTAATPRPCFPQAAIPSASQPASQAPAGLLCDVVLQVFPALTSVLRQYTQAPQAWEGWSPSRSLPCLAGPSPLQIKNVYLKLFIKKKKKSSRRSREALRQQTNMSVILSFKRAGRTGLCLIK